jgi:FkbM family methyltransferase
MKFIKSILYKILSIEAYLTILQKMFYLLYDFNLLKNKEEFKYHYAIKKVIQPTDYVVDIGANLGYFSKNFARLAYKGKVISIEPLPLFYKQLQKLLKGFKNVEIYNCALGDNDGKIKMILPKDNGMIRTGLPHIAGIKGEENGEEIEVEIRKGSAILGSYEKINYIKCDIEGYELFVFEEIYPVLEKQRPIVQIEVADKNKEGILAIFNKLNYTLLSLSNHKFTIASNESTYIGDYFFVPSERVNEFTS